MSRPVARGRCAACGARNAPDAVWCTLCHASLREPPPPRAAPPPGSGPEPEPAAQDRHRPDPPPGAEARAYAEEQAERLLAELSAAGSTPHGERLAAFHRAGPVAGMMFSVVGGAAALVLLIVVLAVIGLLL